ncbi:hypothetical protein J1614_001777 [Plenodomus biglobosus]|nr:hypothetical protein J1614_001777 [Plenodomus biglobosus]
MVARTGLLHGNTVGGTASAQNTSSTSVVPRAPTMMFVSGSDDADATSNTDDDDYIGGHAYAHSYNDGVDSDQDWVVCDKDCGWCGHCGDDVDY